jgi:hypothetical protein
MQAKEESPLHDSEWASGNPVIDVTDESVLPKSRHNGTLALFQNILASQPGTLLTKI